MPLTTQTAPASSGAERPRGLVPPHRRLRRRGPRSLSSLQRRHYTQTAWQSGAVDPVAAEPGCQYLTYEFAIYHINIRGWLSHAAELAGRIQILPNPPSIITLNETLLDASTHNITIPNFSLVSRRDRDSPGGGIATFAHTSIANQIAHVSNSPTAERSWHVLHTTTGPLLFCNWYRPPTYDLTAITDFETEWTSLSTHALNTLIIGDLNLHHAHWLNSPRTTPDGTYMFRFCRDNGFTQHTPAPTHAAGGILDLVITDISGDINVSIEPVININDHNPILCNLRMNTPTRMDY